MHGEELVILFGREQGLVGARELQAHDERLDAAQQKEDEGRSDVALAIFLVIDCGKPTEKPRFAFPVALQSLLGGGAGRAGVEVDGTMVSRDRHESPHFND